MQFVLNLPLAREEIIILFIQFHVYFLLATPDTNSAQPLILSALLQQQTHDNHQINLPLEPITALPIFTLNPN